MAMKLITKEIENKLLKVGVYGQSDKGKDAKVIVKLYNPAGLGTWLITGGEKLENGDWLLYGYCHIHTWEYGPVLLSELEKVKLPYGLKIERDRYCTGTVAQNIR